MPALVPFTPRTLDFHRLAPGLRMATPEYIREHLKERDRFPPPWDRMAWNIYPMAQSICVVFAQVIRYSQASTPTRAATTLNVSHFGRCFPWNKTLQQITL